MKILVKYFGAAAMSIAIACQASANQTDATDTSGPVVLVVAAAAGGALDKVARVTSEKIGAKLGVSVLVQNKAGANGIIGAEYVSRSRPDGNTILFDQSSILLHRFLQERVPFDVDSLVPLSKLVILPHVLVANSSVPVNTAAELQASAKSQPGHFNFSTPGPGSAQQLVVEQMARNMGIKLTHVPYRGGAPAMMAAAGGEVHLSAVSLATTLPFIRNNKVKALAVDAPERLESLPKIPTFKELGYGETMPVWFGTFLPPGTPSDIAKKVNEAIVFALNDPSVRQAMQADGFRIVGNTPDEFAQEIKEETKKGEELIRELNFKIQ